MSMAANLSRILEESNIANISQLTEEMISLVGRYPWMKEINGSILREEVISNFTEHFLDLKMLLEALTPPGTPIMGPSPMMISNTTEGVRAHLTRSRYIDISVLYTDSFCSYHRKIKLLMESPCHQKLKLEEYTEILTNSACTVTENI